MEVFCQSRLTPNQQFRAFCHRWWHFQLFLLKRKLLSTLRRIEWYIYNINLGKIWHFLFFCLGGKPKNAKYCQITLQIYHSMRWNVLSNFYLSMKSWKCPHRWQNVRNCWFGVSRLWCTFSDLRRCSGAKLGGQVQRLVSFTLSLPRLHSF